MRCLFLIPLLLVLGILSGCGGGGGGAATARLVYTTDWTLRGQPGGGLSQRLTLLDLDGRVVQSLVLNSPGSAPQTVELADLVPGSYVLRAEMFSAGNLGGTFTGSVEQPIAISDITNFSTNVGATVSTIRVNPAAISLRIPESAKLYAVGLDLSGTATFTNSTDYTWTALSSTVSVSSAGRVTAVSAGTGSVRATHTPTNARGAASVTVQSSSPTTSKWTILVFLNAANDLYSYSVPNMNQIEQIAGSADVRFVVQWKQTQRIWSNSSFDGTRRYLAKADNTSTIASQLVQDLGGGVDMGSPQTLKSFIAWAKTYYPAERYGLIVWNHGNGWRRTAQRQDSGPKAVSYDDETGNAIQIWQLSTALTGQQFDFLAWDSSLMQMLEVAYEVRNYTKYIVGSEESPPAEGYPYNTVFAPFAQNPVASTVLLTRSFVDATLAVPGYSNRKITQSVLDATKLATLATRIDALAAELISQGNSIAATVQAIRNQSQSYSQSTLRYYRDLDDICARLIAAAVPNSLKTAASSVRSALADAVVHEGHNAMSPGSRGLSIDFSPGSVFAGGAADYGNLQLSQATRWDQWLTVAP